MEAEGGKGPTDEKMYIDVHLFLFCLHQKYTVLGRKIHRRCMVFTALVGYASVVVMEVVGNRTGVLPSVEQKNSSYQSLPLIIG